jgi:sarcosine oxidase subunit beta
MNYDAIIIGAGIHGCSSALNLARAGLKPLVLEQSYPARHASGVNAGGVRRLGRHFDEIPLSVAAMAIWHNIEELLDDDCGFRRVGQVKVAESEDDLMKLKDRVKKLNALGFEHEEIISQSELREILPHVASNCCGGIICKGDGYALPFQTVTAFRKAAVRAGATFIGNHPVDKIERIGNIWKVSSQSIDHEAPVLVNCSGAWARKMSSLLGEEAPVEPVALMLMITQRMPRFCNPVVGATSRPLSFKQFENGTVLIGGGKRGFVDMQKQKASLNVGGLSESATTAHEIFPVMKKIRVIRCWAGIEGVMPDEIPVISPSATYPDAYHVFGFSAHGFQLGPITGRIITDLVLNNKTELPIEKFSIKRFLQ